MAGSRTRMAESTAGSPVRLLIADTRSVPRAAGTGLHEHAFWQLDHCAGGTMVAELSAGGALRLDPGDGLLLPPGCVHGFRYRRGSRYVSWKFTWDGPVLAGAVPLSAQPGWSGVAAALAALAGTPAATVAAPYLLAAAMHLAGAPAPASGDSLSTAVARLVDRQPAQAWTVAGVSRALSLTPGHASARFRAEHGLPLKRWLDIRRAEHAARLLAGSPRSIGDIAADCGFADAFGFSRFFRRVTGESPSTFRSR